MSISDNKLIRLLYISIMNWICFKLFSTETKLLTSFTFRFFDTKEEFKTE